MGLLPLNPKSRVSTRGMAESVRGKAGGTGVSVKTLGRLIVTRDLPPPRSAEGENANGGHKRAHRHIHPGSARDRQKRSVDWRANRFKTGNRDPSWQPQVIA
jgi:hypothetical protein